MDIKAVYDGTGHPELVTIIALLLGRNHEVDDIKVIYYGDDGMIRSESLYRLHQPLFRVIEGA